MVHNLSLIFLGYFLIMLNFFLDQKCHILIDFRIKMQANSSRAKKPSLEATGIFF